MTPELKQLSKQLQEELRRYEEDMAMGKAEDFGAYKYACGIYRGLLIANGFVASLAQYMEDNDD